MQTFLIQAFGNGWVEWLTCRTRKEMNTTIHQYACLVYKESEQSNGLHTEAVCCGKHLQIRNMLHTLEPPL